MYLSFRATFVWILYGCWTLVALVQATPLKAKDKPRTWGASRDASLKDSASRISLPVVPDACTTASGQDGLCISYDDCTHRGGTPDGTCYIFKLTSCCSLGQRCGAISTYRESTFVNRNYPNPEAVVVGGNCRMGVKPLNNNICQLRLDLIEFTLAQPNDEGVCVTDYMSVTGGSRVPDICGQNSGQHMYVDVGPNFYVLITFFTESVANKWRVKVTQIPCGSPDIAPAGCLQYYTATSGTITSFNYNSTGASPTDTRQLAKQMYGVCIKSQPAFCSVTYKQAPGAAFSMSSDPASLPPTVPAPPTVGLECTSDYLFIPNGRILDTANLGSPAPATADRFCGLSFPGVTSNLQPFNLNVITNDNEAADGDNYNQGFKLSYALNSCTGK